MVLRARQGERGVESKVKGNATRDQCSRSKSATSGLGLATGPGCGLVGFEGGRADGGRQAGRWWLVLARRTTPADALSAKLQVELISRGRGKGWGGFAQESGQGPCACPGWPCTLASYRGTLYRGGPWTPATIPVPPLWLSAVPSMRVFPGAARNNTVYVLMGETVTCGSTPGNSHRCSEPEQELRDTSILGASAYVYM